MEMGLFLPCLAFLLVGLDWIGFYGFSFSYILSV